MYKMYANIPMTALLLPAVGGLRWQTCITRTTNQPVAVGLSCKCCECGFDESTAKTEHEMESRLLLNVVIRKCTTVFKLLAGEDETLLVGWDTFLVLNLGLHIVNCV